MRQVKLVASGHSISSTRGWEGRRSQRVRILSGCGTTFSRGKAGVPGQERLRERLAWETRPRSPSNSTRMAASGSSWTYLGIQDACFHPGHTLVLPEELDLADFAELGQHGGEVCLQINDMADAMARPHQEGGG